YCNGSYTGIFGGQSDSVSNPGWEYASAICLGGKGLYAESVDVTTIGQWNVPIAPGAQYYWRQGDPALIVGAGSSKSAELNALVLTFDSKLTLGNSSYPGQLKLVGIGAGLSVPAGVNAKMGTATLSSGTVTVANTGVKRTV